MTNWSILLCLWLHSGFLLWCMSDFGPLVVLRHWHISMYFQEICVSWACTHSMFIKVTRAFLFLFSITVFVSAYLTCHVSWTHVCNILRWTGVHVFGLHFCSSDAKHQCLRLHGASFYPEGWHWFLCCFSYAFIFFTSYSGNPFDLIFSNIEQLKSYRSMHIRGAEFSFSLPRMLHAMTATRSVTKKQRFRYKQQEVNNVFATIFLRAWNFLRANWKVQKCQWPWLLPGLHISLSSQDALSHMASPVRPPPLSEAGAFFPPVIFLFGHHSNSREDLTSMAGFSFSAKKWMNNEAATSKANYQLFSLVPL